MSLRRPGSANLRAKVRAQTLSKSTRGKLSTPRGVNADCVAKMRPVPPAHGPGRLAFAQNEPLRRLTVCRANRAGTLRRESNNVQCDGLANKLRSKSGSAGRHMNSLGHSVRWDPRRNDSELGIQSTQRDNVELQRNCP